MEVQPEPNEEFEFEIEHLVDIFLEDEIDKWFEIASDLYEVILQLEEQLSELGYGLRPFSIQALRAFEEMTEDGD